MTNPLLFSSDIVMQYVQDFIYGNSKKKKENKNMIYLMPEQVEYANKWL